MKHKINISFALLILFFLTGCMVPHYALQEAMHKKGVKDYENTLDSQSSYYRSTQREQALLTKMKEYEQKGLILSLSGVHGELSDLYWRNLELGKSLEHAEKGLKLIGQLDEQKLMNIHDDGNGRTLAEYMKTKYYPLPPPGTRLPLPLYEYSDYFDNYGEKEAKKMLKSGQTTAFLKAKSSIYSMLVQNYKIIGEQAKENEFLKKGYRVSEENKEWADEFYKQYFDWANQHQPEYGKLKFQEYMKTLNHYQTAGSGEMSRATGMLAEIIKEHYSGNFQKVDELIEKYVKTSFPSDQPPNEIAFVLKKEVYEHYNANPEDVERIRDYCTKHIGIPRSLYVKAWLNHRLGRSRAAADLVGKAIQIFSDREMIKVGSSIMGYKLVLREKVDYYLPRPDEIPLAWRILQADAITKLGDMQAVALWEGIVQDVDQFTPLARRDKATISKDETLQQAFLGLSEIYEKMGNTDKAAEYYDRVLQLRESSRASFSVEAHKIGYLAKNNALYEKFINLYGQEPINSLIAMERAKSRAMVDLMAERIHMTGDPVLRKVFAQKMIISKELEQSSSGPQQRAIEVVPPSLPEDILKLKQTKPELYSLVSVEPFTKEELFSLVQQDTAVLSYYVADDYMIINLYQKEGMAVEKVSVPKGALYACVYDYRNKINNPEHRSFKGQIGLDISWTVNKSKEKFVLKNKMPFPLEILQMERGVKSINPQFFNELQMLSKYQEDYFQNILLRGTIDSSGETKVTTINPGEKKEIAVTDLEFKEPAAYDEIVRITTNIGTFWLRGILEQESEEKASIIEIDKSKTNWKLDEINLYDLLIKPVEKKINAKHLIIIPHSVLHFLPFEAIKDNNEKYLIEKYAVSYAPSLNVLKYCKQKNSGQKSRLVAYGDPLGDLSFARVEVDRIQNYFTESNVFTGQEVTLQKVLGTIKSGDIIHFACHGIFNPASPFNSALLLSGKDGSAEPLTVSSLLGLKMNPYLTTLSACDTGLARISGGDELLGLVRGFFVAGSPSLVTTLWPIDDKSTSLFMARFYENLITKNMNKADAIRDAKLYLMNEGYKRPYYWAAFILQGDWI